MIVLLSFPFSFQEYVPGGDFRTLLNNSGVLKEEHARFYISEMFCSVDALHKLGYIHRDLKPEVSVCRHRVRASCSLETAVAVYGRALKHNPRCLYLL